VLAGLLDLACVLESLQPREYLRAVQSGGLGDSLG
jgi:hypothetical protein